MTTGLILVIGSILLGSIILGLKNKLENNIDQNYNIMNKNIFKDNTAKYLGGYPEISGDKNSIIAISSNSIDIKIGNIKKIISINDLINAEIMSERQIESSISLGKIALVGVLALGMKTQKTIIKNYLVITLKENEEKRDIIIESNNLEKLTREIRKIKNNQL